MTNSFTIRSVFAVFGSSSPAVDASVAGVCNALHVPYLSTLTKTEGGGGGGFVARMGPVSRHLSMAVRDLVGEMAWREVAVVVHRESGECARAARTYVEECDDRRPRCATFNESPSFIPSGPAGEKVRCKLLLSLSLPLSHSLLSLLSLPLGVSRPNKH